MLFLVLYNSYSSMLHISTANPSQNEMVKNDSIFIPLPWHERGSHAFMERLECLLKIALGCLNPGHPWTGEYIETTLKKINLTCWQRLQTSWIGRGRGWMLCFVCCDLSLFCAQWPMETAREIRLTKTKRCVIQAHSNQPVKQPSRPEHGLVAF